MRILVLSPRSCWPVNNGAKLREYHLTRILSRQAEVSLLAFADAGGGPSGETLPFCRRVVTVPRPKMYRPAQVVGSLLRRTALPIANYTSEAMRVALARLLDEKTFDLVQMESIHMLGYEEVLRRKQPQALIAYDWHNIESELMLRFAGGLPQGPKRWYAHLTAGQLAEAERGVLRRAGGHIVCSSREQLILRSWRPQARVEVVANGVDTAAFTPPELPKRNRILFVGLMSYHANIEAAVYFARHLWPGLRPQLPPDTEFTIVGAQPAPEVLALNRLDRVTVTGTVPEVQPYYGEALAAVVPLKTGGGTRLKILEAMAAGVPVVSTSLGAEGLDIAPGVNILIADHDNDWMTHLRALTTQAGPRRELVEQALHLVRARYDWERLGEHLAEIYRRWLGERSGEVETGSQS